MTTSEFISALHRAAGPGCVSERAADRTMYATDMWPRAQIWRLAGEPARHPPLAVVWPASVEHLQAIIRTCADHGVALIPYGGGSGVCGGTLPIGEAVILDLKRLDRIRSVDRRARVVCVEAGVIGEVLERTLEAAGLTLGHFPSSIYCSTVGGWVATRSAGQYSSRYGKIEDMVLSLRFVDGTGTLRDTSLLDHNAAGLRLLPTLIGSEGTLGVVTDVTLRVHPRHPAEAFRGFEVPNVKAGIELVRELVQADHPPLVLRLYDPLDTMMNGLHRARDPAEPAARGPRGLLKGVADRFAGRAFGSARDRLGGAAHALEQRANAFALGHPHAVNRLARVARESCLVIVGYEGDAASTDAAMTQALALAARLGGRDLGAGPGLAWRARRHHVSFKQAPVFREGACADTMEIATTWDNLYRVYDQVIRTVSPLAVTMAHFSHAYVDGCSIYFTFALGGLPPDRLEERYSEVWQAATGVVVELGAVVAHHHGVGLAKRHHMPAQLEGGVSVIHALQRVFDPARIMNPGKLVPPEVRA